MFYAKSVPQSAGWLKNLEGFNSVVRCHLYSAVSRYDVDKSIFVHFVNSVR